MADTGAQAATYTFDGKDYALGGQAIYEGSDEDGPWQYEEFTLKFSNGKRAWLEYDEGACRLWDEPSLSQMDVKSEDGRSLRFDFSKKEVQTSDGKRFMGLGETKPLMIEGKKLYTTENEVVKVKVSQDEDMDAGEKLWYIDVSAGSELYTVEVYEDGSVEVSRGRNCTSSQFPWLSQKSVTAKAFGGLGFLGGGGTNAKGSRSLGLIVVITVIAFFACGWTGIFADSDDGVPVTFSCQTCAEKCGDLKSPNALWNNVVEVSCTECAQYCIEPNGFVNTSKIVTSARPALRGSRTYGRSYGGK